MGCFFASRRRSASGLLLLLYHEVEMIVEPCRSRLCAGAELLLPLVAVTQAVDIQASHQDTARAIQALDPSLHPHDVSDPRHVDSRELAEARELTRCLEDRPVEVPHAQLLGQAIRIALVALRPSALPDPRNHDLVHVRTQRLVQPRALESLFEDQNLPARNHADSLDQGLAVGLDREVLQPLPGLRDHRQRAARGVNVHPDGSFHRCLLSLGVVDFPTRGFPTGSGGTTFRFPPGSRLALQTPPPMMLIHEVRKENRCAHPAVGGRPGRAVRYSIIASLRPAPRRALVLKARPFARAAPSGNWTDASYASTSLSSGRFRRSSQ